MTRQTRISGGEKQQTNQIPSLCLDTPKLILCNDSPNTVRDICAILECEVQFDFIADFVVELDDTPDDLVNVLEEIMTWAKGKSGV